MPLHKDIVNIRRLGTFSIALEYIHSNIVEVANIFKFLEFVPTKCEFNFSTNAYEYTGISYHFKEQPLGCFPPIYTIIIHSFENGENTYSVEYGSSPQNKGVSSKGRSSGS